MSLATRSKPFRYATAKPLKSSVYKAAALAGPPVYSAGLSAGADHVAVGYGASKGSVLLLPVDASLYKSSASPFTLSAHGCELGDLAFSPHAPSTLATAAMDGTVKLWSVPSTPLDANISTPAAKFEGMDAVHSLAWHPSAEGVLAAGGKAGLNVFDVTAGKEAYAFKTEGFGKDVTSLHWNRTGSLLAAVTKNAALSVVDPRSAAANVLGSAVPSTLIKKLQHGVFIGGEGAVPEFLLLFGVAASQRPVMMWVDPRNPTAAVKTHDFDFSQGYALPVYEPDTTTLYYTIRGSEMLALLDVESEKNAPSVWPSHQFAANSAIKGFALLPKRAVATNSAEVNRVYTLGAESVDAFSVTVPRKTAGFHAELFPDTNDCKAAQSASEWAAGADKAPLKTSMVAIHENGGAGAAAASAASAAGLATATSRLSVSSPTAAAAASSSSASSVTSPANRAASSSVASDSPASRASSGSVATRPASTSVAYVPSDMRAKIDSTLKKSPFTHCMGKEPASHFQSYFDTNQGPSLSLAENIRTNGSFFACPWKASGGSALAVFRIAPDALGRCSHTQCCVRGHKFPASSFDFSPFQSTQLASGCVDGTIFLWRIPEKGLVKDLVDPESALSSQGKVGMLRFHPYAADILIAATGGFDGQFLEVWDVSNPGNQSAPAFSIKVGEEEPVVDFSVHPHSHLVATSSRDGKVRVWSFASRAMLAEWAVPQNKDTRVLWVGESKILTVGFGAQGVRSISLFDTSASPPALLQTLELERVNYSPLPRFDFDTRLLFLANSGGTFIPLFQLSDAAPYIEPLNVFQTASDTTGFILLPKASADVRKVEVMRALKLTKDAILPISYTVPRKRVEFFQDDLFPPTRQAGPELTALQFVQGSYDKDKGQAWTKVSLQPQGMELLSTAPEEEATVRQQKYTAKLAADVAPKPVGALGHTSEAEVREHFLGLQANVGGANRWDARVDSSRVDVDESEWD